MDRARIGEGVRQMRFAELLDRHEGGEFGQETAAQMLAVSDRTFRRWQEMEAGASRQDLPSAANVHPREGLTELIDG